MFFPARHLHRRRITNTIGDSVPARHSLVQNDQGRRRKKQSRESSDVPRMARVQKCGVRRSTQTTGHTEDRYHNPCS